MPEELIDYVKRSLANKVPEATIRENLQKVGWSTNKIEKVFQQLDTSPDPNGNIITNRESLSSFIQSEEPIAKGEPPTKKISHKKIFVSFLIFSFVTTPIYFLTPDGLLIRLLFPNERLSTLGLAGATDLIMAHLIVIPIIAGILSTLTIVGLNMLRRVGFGDKIVAYIFLGIAAIGVLFPFYSIVSLRLSYSTEVSSIPSKVDFQIYKPNSGSPFKNLHESYQISSESSDKRCIAVQYSYYGSTSGAILTEMKVGETNCPDAFYLNASDYDKYSKIADTGKVEQYTNYKVTSKKVGGATVLVVYDTQSGLLISLYGIKSNTLIIVRAGCTVTDDHKECEQKYLDFYASLEPLK
ncbi:MAG: hypothetical protein AAB609_00540 [Patescibacteria group bacterium]